MFTFILSVVHVSIKVKSCPPPLSLPLISYTPSQLLKKKKTSLSVSFHPSFILLFIHTLIIQMRETIQF